MSIFSHTSNYSCFQEDYIKPNAHFVTDTLVHLNGIMKLSSTFPDFDAMFIIGRYTSFNTLPMVV